ncbi:MAG: hypothetical protein NTW29_03190 [Bacteroidetes bacterium]|nr:hypothetical protein [Bacteroidota bacterium]
MLHEKFISKPFSQFVDFHIGINDYVKLSTSAIDNLVNHSQDEKLIAKLIFILIKDAGERWVPTTYKNPIRKLKELRSQLAQSAIMWVFSSFEVFLNRAHSELSEVIQVNTRSQREELKESIRLKELFVKHKWSLEEIEYLLTVFDFYGLSRHCIVHNMGKATAELESMASSQKFVSAINNWPTVIPGRKLSPIPTINKGGLIQFKPHHAITYSDICFRVSKIINRNILETLGFEHYVAKVAKEQLLIQSKLVGQPCRDMYSYIRYHLLLEYKFNTVTETDLKDILEQSGLRKRCLAKYTSLKKNVDH